MHLTLYIMILEIKSAVFHWDSIDPLFFLESEDHELRSLLDLHMPLEYHLNRLFEELVNLQVAF